MPVVFTSPVFIFSLRGNLYEKFLGTITSIASYTARANYNINHSS